MAQTASTTVVNDTGAAVRSQLNVIIAALLTANAGPSAPPATVPFMVWLDTSVTPPRFRTRNAADNGWDMLLDGGAY